jgi:hypothetical protein
MHPAGTRLQHLLLCRLQGCISRRCSSTHNPGLHLHAGAPVWSLLATLRKRNEPTDPNWALTVSIHRVWPGTPGLTHYRVHDQKLSRAPCAISARMHSLGVLCRFCRVPGCLGGVECIDLPRTCSQHDACVMQCEETRTTGLVQHNTGCASRAAWHPHPSASAALAGQEKHPHACWCEGVRIAVFCALCAASTAKQSTSPPQHTTTAWGSKTLS